MRGAARAALFGALTAVGTAAAGWWIVPILAALWVRALPSGRNPIATTMFGAAVGWLMLLCVVAFRGPAAAVAAMCSATLGLPRWGFPLVTLLFPAALAGAAALLTKSASTS